MSLKTSSKSLSTKLRTSLQKAERIAVLAVGSEFRADDAAGLLAGKELQRLTDNFCGEPALKVFMGETAPENLTGPIKEFKPTHLIIIDAADMSQPPGHIELIDPEQVADTGSFSTHSLPLNVLTDYLCRTLNCRVLIVAIQPESCKFGRRPSRAIITAARSAARQIAQSLEEQEI